IQSEKGLRVSEQQTHPSLIASARRPATVALQLVFVGLSHWMAFLLRFDGTVQATAAELFWATLPWLVGVRALAFIGFRLNEGLWRYAGLYDLRAIVFAVVTSSVGFVLLTLLPFGPPAYPISILIIDAVLLTLMLAGGRLTRRMISERGHGHSG